MSPSFQAGHALLIGAGADLPFTIDDARGIADILKYRSAAPILPARWSSSSASPPSPPRESLMHSTIWRAGDEFSTVVVYFSGHGYHATTPIGDAYFLNTLRSAEGTIEGYCHQRFRVCLPAAGHPLQEAPAAAGTAAMPAESGLAKGLELRILCLRRRWRF